MAHWSRVDMIVVDVPAESHDAELAFWQGATGHELRNVSQFPEFSGSRLYGDGVGFLVQRTGDDTTRVHIDIHTDDLVAEVARLQGLGAVAVSEHDQWVVMRDPAGLVFCVVAEPGRVWDDDKVTRWP